MALVNINTTNPSPEIQDLLFGVFNRAALKYAKDYSWSTYHSWHVLNDATDAGDGGMIALGRNFWHTMAEHQGRFASCLGVSTLIMTELRSALLAHPEQNLRQYGKTVQLMTCAKHATSETKYHAVVAMCFDTFAFVIDHALHPTAMNIPLDTDFYMSAYIPLFGPEGIQRFKYLCEGGHYKLIMDDGSRQKAPTFGPLYFSEMDIDAATIQLAIPAATELQPVKGQEHILMPPRKYVSIRSLLEEEPRLIAAVPVDDKWLATTLRVQIDFANPMLTMQIPMADWLIKRQGKDWLKTLMRAPQRMQVIHTEATVLLQVELDAQKYEQPYFELPELAILWRLSGEFELDYTVLMKMVNSVYDMWKPYRSKRADSIIDCDIDDDTEVRP